MHHHLLSGRFDDLGHAVADQVIRERDEAGRAVVHDHLGILFQNALDHGVNSRDVDRVIFDQDNGLRTQGLDGDETAVDGVGIEADRQAAVLPKILGDQGCHPGFPNAAFPLQDDMDAARPPSRLTSWPVPTRPGRSWGRGCV